MYVCVYVIICSYGTLYCWPFCYSIASMLVYLIVGIDKEIYGFLKKCVYKTTLQQHPSKYCHKIYWNNAISTINPFKQLKRALKLKLLNSKIFKNC